MEDQTPMRIAVIGCGQIAWVHLSHITRFKLGEVVGICDFYRPQLEKTGRAFNLQNLYTDPAEMLAQVKPDVVHVVTPPPTHADLAMQAMRAGCHVLVEKPMALSVEQADRMIAIALETGRSLCVDHNRLFTPPTLEARRLLETGQLGELVSVDFYQGAGFPFWMTTAEIENQWFAKLPGGMVQDLAPHCLYSLLEFVGIPAKFHVVVKKNGLQPAAPAEEVRLIMAGERILGTGTISLSAQPYMNYFTLYGSRMTARVNLETFTLLVKRDRFTHHLLRKSTGGVDEGFRMAAGTIGSMMRFATGKLPRYPGILEMIRRFYRSIQDGGPSPVQPEQGREVVRLMDEVISVMRQVGTEAKMKAPAVVGQRTKNRPRILVTGATGLVGGALVRRLLSRGLAPRTLARPSPRAHALREIGVDTVLGDISNAQSVAKSVEGVEVVFHCAARMGTQGTWEDFHRESVEGTANVLRSAHATGVRRVIYVSSLSVYGVPNNGDCINEATAYEPNPDKRGSYSKAKLESEKLVLQFARDTGLPVTVFRPGMIFGRGRPLPTAPLAFPSPFSTSFVVIGASSTLLALNYIENLLDAFDLALERPESVGKQYNIIDDERLTTGEYHRIRGGIDGTRAVFVPAWPFRLASPGIEILASRSGGGKLATFSSHALARTLKSIRYESHAVREELGWRPRVGLEDALREVVAR